MTFTAFRTWVAGEVPTAALLNAQVRDNGLILKTSIADDGTLAGILFSRTTSDFIKNANTTLGDVSGLSFPIAASEVWLFYVGLSLDSSVTADIKLGLTAPSGATGRWGNTLNAVSASIASNLTAATIGTDELYIITGLVVNSTNAGTVQLQAAQNTSDATNTTIFTHSHILAVKVA